MKLYMGIMIANDPNFICFNTVIPTKQTHSMCKLLKWKQH